MASAGKPARGTAVAAMSETPAAPELAAEVERLRREVDALREQLALQRGDIRPAGRSAAHPPGAPACSHGLSQDLSMITDLAGIGVWSRVHDSETPIWNDQLRRIFGLGAQDPLPTASQIIEHWVLPADRAAVGAEYRRVMQAEEASADIEYRIRRPDGAIRWLLLRGRWSRRGSGVQAFGAIIDITERRSAEAALRRAEERSAVATRAVGMGTWELDVGSRVPQWDAQMYRLRGLEPDDPRPVDRIIEEITPPGDRPMAAERSIEAARAGVGYSNEFRVLMPDGSIRWLASRGTLVAPAQDNARLRMFGVNWDVTEQKRAEQALREKAAAEQANQAKSVFLARMSHELRTPLNAVLGFSDLMLGDPAEALPPSQQARAEHIQRAGRHLLALIDDVLDLTGIEAGRLPLLDEAVEIDRVLAEVLRWTAPQALAAGVSLERRLIGRQVGGDAKRWHQVFANLLSNAVKYNSAGGSVTVEPAAEAAGGEWVVVSVRDSGRGLSALQLRQLFEPFNRLGAEREGIEGTGIGLSIVKLLSERMGGRVAVRSTPGRGSEFQIWMRAAAEPRAMTQTTEAAVRAAPAEGRAAPLDVVYIEDNPVNMLLVAELMSLRPALALHEAVNGMEGVALGRRLRAKVVLIDMQLPDIDGFEVLRRLRADPALAASRCVALSANAMPDDISRARAAGFDDYWTKPIDARRFLAGLDGLITPLLI